MNDYPPISIEVNGVSVIYNNSVKALDDVSFELNGGTVCGLIGMNGSGKSSLFNTIMGIIKPQKGSVFLNKMPVKKAIRENMVSYVPQAEQIDWNFPIRVYDVVMQGRFAHMGFLRNPSMKDKQMVDEALIKMDISNLAHRQIGELSGGQKKRVFLARTLAQQSKIILLDEPFTGVDVKTELAIMHLLEELRQQGYLILVATHNLGSVPDYCNEVIMLNRSLIVAGETDLVFTQENLIQTFGGVLKNILLDTKDKTAIHVVSDDERAAVFYNYKPVSRPDCE